jgi:hypothetical protein
MSNSTPGRWFFLTILVASMMAQNAGAEAVGHITGVGGVFFKSPDPKAQSKWYNEVLGLSVKP